MRSAYPASAKQAIQMSAFDLAGTTGVSTTAVKGVRPRDAEELVGEAQGSWLRFRWCVSLSGKSLKSLVQRKEPWL